MKYFFIMLLILNFAFGRLAWAQSPLAPAQEMLTTGGQAAYGQGAKTDLPVLIGQVIKILLGVSGAIVMIFTFYGGFLYMTAGGNTEQIKEAKNWITNGIIGLIICVLAYAITTFVVDQISNVTR